MKIDNSVKPHTGNGIAGNRGTGKSSSGEKATQVDSVNVQLSPLSSQLQTIGSSSGNVVDTAQVAEIKQAIAEGRFTINPEAIADRLLESVKELISNSRN